MCRAFSDELLSGAGAGPARIARSLATDSAFLLVDFVHRGFQPKSQKF
jgi:hypothetical protein